MTKTKQSSVFASQATKRFLDTFASVTLDGDELRQEVESLHEGRTASKLDRPRKNKKIGPNTLRAAATREQAVRSRIVGIQMEINEVLGSVEPMRDATVAYMMAHYSNRIPIKGVTDQRTYLRSGLEARLPWFDALSKAREAAKYVIEDIDKASWNLRLIATTFELNTRPEM